MNNTTKLIIALVLGLILGYLIGVATGGNDSEVEMDAEMHNEEEMMMENEEGEVMGASENVAMGSGVNSVSVINQPAGSMVSVSGINLEQDSWITVVEAADTNPWILGAAWLPAGEHVGASVELLRNTETGNTYTVMLRADNGDRSFDKDMDVLVGDMNGAVVSSSFLAL